MTKKSKPLTDLELRRVTEPGLYFAGDGLYQQVTGTNARSWLFRYSLRGKARMMGLGSARHLTLKEARHLRDEARSQWAHKIDPIDARKQETQRLKLEQAKSTTFRQAAEQYVAAHGVDWKNQKHAAQWGSTLATYVYPIIGEIPVQMIDRALVLKVLDPIWTTKPETARRVRGRIEVILDWAEARGLRAEGANPARLQGPLSKALPARKRTVEHHAALPYSDIGAFITNLRQRDGIAARALEFAVLTAARTGEVLGATWSEIDLSARLWTVEGHRMKAGREHRVPLSAATVDILQRVHSLQHGNGIVFPNVGRGKALSNMAMLKMLERMNRADLTVHGFRSTFRTWAAERTNFQREVIEAALAHVTGDKVEAAYQRGDMFEKRRRLMDAWAEFCAKPVVAADRGVVAFQAPRRSAK